MSPETPSWPENFPQVLVLSTLSAMKRHPAYTAAKSGSSAAARRLVFDLLHEPAPSQKIRALAAAYPYAVVVPIHAVQTNGVNQIPGAIADYIGIASGLAVDDSIVQTNSVRRTGASLWHRIACRPAFDGKVQPGKQYIAVDDVVTSGGSLSELRRYIEKNGGSVVRFSSAAAASYSASVAISENTRASLEKFYGVPQLKSFLKEFDLYDGNYKALTESEGRAIRGACSLTEAGNRIITARQENLAQTQHSLVQNSRCVGVARPPERAAPAQVKHSTGLRR